MGGESVISTRISKVVDSLLVTLVEEAIGQILKVFQEKKKSHLI